MGRKLIIHLGFPKTGTSYLQKNIFPKMAGINFIGRRDNFYSQEAKGLKDFVTFLLFIPEDAFLDRLSSMKGVLLNINKAHFNYSKSEKLPILLSDEALIFRTIDPFNVRWHGKYSASIDRLFRRLKIFVEFCDFDLKLILTLRNQADLIHSVYSERYNVYRNIADINTFSKYLSAILNSKFYDYGMSNLQYDRLIDKIKFFFENDRLLVLKYEQMKKDPLQFYERLLGFLPSDSTVSELSSEINFKAENKREIGFNKKIANLGYKLPRVLKKLNLFTVRLFIKSGLTRESTVEEYILNNGFWFQKYKIINMTQSQRSLINGTFYESNKSLAQAYNEFLDYTNG
ncbi:hypothetical protein G3I01_11080 [Gramella sp. MT6]|uniref:sulfotransferase domain-containing protein n=1 Tax=Gramella sp. MT6 TaxID=2705471 RepID=UPI001C5F15C1|nr:sulfotransferase domain-containing protein [Gramella sp. MT6]QYA26035.1 hypothetical protein G3I01_11080 [Gramella sp. MT6]